VRDFPRMMNLRNIRIFTLALAAAFSISCSDDKDDDKDDEQEEGLSGDCAAIVEACHEADEGAGAVHECHEVAHANKVAECTAALQGCVQTCKTK
jgi:hypothetical protein